MYITAIKYTTQEEKVRLDESAQKKITKNGFGLNPCPADLLGLGTIVTLQPLHGHLCMRLVEPKRPRIRLVWKVRDHEKSRKAPDHGDDSIDHEQPPG